MNANHRQGRRFRSKGGDPDRTRVAYIPAATCPEDVSLDCFELGSLRSRR